MAFDLEMACHNARARVAKAVNTNAARHLVLLSFKECEITVRQQFARRANSVSYQSIEMAHPLYFIESGSLFVQCAWRDARRLRHGFVQYNDVLWQVKQWGFSDGPHGNDYGLWAELK